MKIVRKPPLHNYNFHIESLGFIDRLLIRSKKEGSNFNRRMFDEDFANIFHYSNRNVKNLFDVDSNNSQIADRLLSNIKTRYGPEPIDDAVREIVEEIARSLVWFGKAYYFLYDNLGDNSTIISSFRAERVWKLFGFHFQFIPKRKEINIDKNDEIIGREVRILDRKRVLFFRTPSSIRGLLSSQNSIISSLDKNQHPSSDLYPRVTHENPYPHNDFDFQLWRDMHDTALYRATRRTGWNGRKYDAQKRSDFFDCYRLIRFRKNQLIFRDKILEQLSRELSKVGGHYQSGFKISISPTSSLPSVAELNNLRSRLSREEAGFNEVLDFCLKH